jgi:hypothetical protein
METDIKALNKGKPPEGVQIELKSQGPVAAPPRPNLPPVPPLKAAGEKVEPGVKIELGRPEKAKPLEGPRIPVSLRPAPQGTQPAQFTIPEGRKLRLSKLTLILSAVILICI